MKLSAAEESSLIELVSRCHYDAHDAFKEQTQIESPFPKQRGNILENPWPIYQEFYEGKHWQRMGKMPGWKSCPVDNRVFATCEGMTTFLTDNRAKAQFLPVEQDDAELSDKIQSVWNLWCSQVAYDSQQPLAVLDSRKFGVGWLTLKRDKKAPLGQRLEVVSPDMVRVDPDCTAADYLSGKGPSYLVYEYLAPLGDLKAQFTDIDYEMGFDSDWYPNGGITFFDRVARAMGLNTNVRNPAVTVHVFELWIRDNAEMLSETDIADKTVVRRKKKYPGGRRVIVAGGRVLLDEANPYKHGEFPFVPILAYPEATKFYCTGDVQNIIGPQVMLNRYHQLIFDSTVKSGGGILMVNPNYGVTADMITNDPMQVIEVTRNGDLGQAMRFEKYPAPSRHITEQISVLSKVIDDAAGLHDISRGTYTPGNKTAQEIAALTESDKTRVRKGARWLAWANEQIARQWLSNAAQWGDWEVFVRITQEDEDDMLVGVSGDDLKKRNEEGISEDTLRFDVQISDSSTLPTYFQERKQMAQDLFDRNVIDAQALLEMLEFPGWRATIARMKGAKQNESPDTGGSEQAQDVSMATQMPQGMPPQGMPPEMPQGMTPQMPPQGMPMAQDAQPMDVQHQMGDPNSEMMQAIMQVAAQTGLPPEQVAAAVMQGQM